MSIDVLRGHHVHLGGLRPLFDWLRQMRAALSVPLNACASLSERHRRDAGITCHGIGRAVDADIARIGLLHTGWRQHHR